MKLLSLDLSSLSSGFAVFVDGKLTEYGVIKNNSEMSLVERGHNTADRVKELVEKYKGFDVAVVEELKVLKNQKTLNVLGIHNGMVVRALKGIEVVFVMPTVWRASFGLNAKREVAKKKAIELCHKKGVKVACDDEAEAILLGKSYLTKLK